MGRQRTINDVAFWRSPKMAGRTQEDRAMLTYLLTGPFSNIIGVYQIVPRIAASEMGWDTESQMVPVLLRLRDAELVEFDPESSFVWVRIWWDHNSASMSVGGTLRQRTIEQITDIPPQWRESFVADFLARLPAHGSKKHGDAASNSQRSPQTCDFRQQLVLSAYLSRYQDVAYYRSSPCFTATGCTDAQRQALADAQVNGSEAQKRANDAVLKGVDQQQQTLVTDAANLRSLQAQASSAQGQLQAIQAANQLASAQTNQLLQLRGLLVAQQAAAATRAQIVADREAQQAAAGAQLRDGSNITRSAPKSWTFE